MAKQRRKKKGFALPLLVGGATAAMGYYGKVQYENIKDMLEEIKELDDKRKRRIHEGARARLPKKRSTKKAQGGLVTNFKGTF